MKKLSSPPTLDRSIATGQDKCSSFRWPALALIVGLLVAKTAFGVPTVVRAVPDNGDIDVDPKLTEIRIEFDQDMNPGGYSICGSGPGMPQATGEPRWKNRRVFVIPVRLEPGREYTFAVNCPAASNFKNLAGQSAVMYPITFRTSGSAVAPQGRALTAKENSRAIEELRKLVDKSYSYRDLREVPWGRVFRQYEARLKKAKTQSAFARLAARLLAHAKDVHIWLTVDGFPFASHQRRFTPNYNLDLLPRLVPAFTRHNAIVATGRFEDDIGYILISSWPAAGDSSLEPAFAYLAEAKRLRGLIIDVRTNAGGDERTAMSFAGCFVQKPAVYAKHEARSDWSMPSSIKPVSRIVEPATDRPRFRGKAVVLIGPGVMSSCESFVLMMKHGAGALLVGDTTYGSSGNPQPHELSNGVTVGLPSWRDMQPDGALIEGKGIKPDLRLRTKKGDFAEKDPVLEAALKQLRKESAKRR